MTGTDEEFMAIAMEELRASYEVGGIPVGAALVSKEGKLLSQGRNLRIQEGSAIKHAETVALETLALHPPPPHKNHPAPASLYVGGTIYTTLIPCVMCTGAMLLYGIKRVVYGCKTDVAAKPDTIALLTANGVECVFLEVEESGRLLSKWIEDNQEAYRREPWARD